MANNFTEYKTTQKGKKQQACTTRDHVDVGGHRNLNFTEWSVISHYRNFNAPKICKITVKSYRVRRVRCKKYGKQIVSSTEKEHADQKTFSISTTALCICCARNVGKEGGSLTHCLYKPKQMPVNLPWARKTLFTQIDSEIREIRGGGAFDESILLLSTNAGFVKTSPPPKKKKTTGNVYTRHSIFTAIVTLHIKNVNWRFALTCCTPADLVVKYRRNKHISTAELQAATPFRRAVKMLQTLGFLEWWTKIVKKTRVFTRSVSLFFTINQ